jgi:hypothetical protein
VEKSIFTLNGRPLRVLFLGNDDNYNYRMAKWSREFGVEADLWVIQPADPLRGDIRLLEPDLDGRFPAWVMDVPLGDGRLAALWPGGIGRRIEETYDFVGVCGTASLMASLRLRCPRGLTAIGAEIGDLPFPFKPGYATSMGTRPMRYNVSIALLVRAALRRLDFIIDSYQAHDNAYERLRLNEKRSFRGMAADCAGERARVRRELLDQLVAKYGAAQRVFMWFSRLNFTDPDALIYKGAERFLQALEAVLPALESGRVRVIMGKHGNELAEFMQLVDRSPAKPYIDWVPHLGAPELVTYLSLPNGVLFAEFGATQRELSGIGRDAASIGTVTVSSAEPQSMERQYGVAGPLLRALTTEEIAGQMRDLIDMSDDKLRSRQAAMRQFGEAAVDYHAHIPYYYGLVQRSIARRGNAARLLCT